MRLRWFVFEAGMSIKNYHPCSRLLFISPLLQTTKKEFSNTPGLKHPVILLYISYTYTSIFYVLPRATASRAPPVRRQNGGAQAPPSRVSGSPSGGACLVKMDGPGNGKLVPSKRKAPSMSNQSSNKDTYGFNLTDNGKRKEEEKQ